MDETRKTRGPVVKKPSREKPKKAGRTRKSGGE
jgi:hypothetical protein